MSKNRFIHEISNIDGITQHKISTIYLKFNKPKIITFLKNKKYLTEFDEIDDQPKETFNTIYKEIEETEKHLKELEKKKLEMLDISIRNKNDLHEIEFIQDDFCNKRLTKRLIPVLPKPVKKTKLSLDDFNDIFVL